MFAYLLDWFNLFFRTFHVIAGIAWIGASFYFVWLDNNLQEPPNWKKDKGVKGDLWAIHGGGFYEVAKYQLAPPEYPKTLHWFKWEAYTTWLTGMMLLIIVYYFGADAFLVDHQASSPLEPFDAILSGIALIAFGFLCYEILIRSTLRHQTIVFAIILFILLSALTWFSCQLFSPRGAFIHIGAIIGTIMAGNVFFGIIPAQRALVAAVREGRAPDPTLGTFAKLRSTHNNYLTLPLIFIMLSNHFPMIISSDISWLLLIYIAMIGVVIRLFFNLKHQGVHKPSILVAASVMLLILIWAMAPKQSYTPKITKESALVTNQQVKAIINTHCVSCHSAQPTDTIFKVAPLGIQLDTLTQVRAHAMKIQQVAVYSQLMPLANKTQMSVEERKQLGNWFRQEKEH